MFNYHAANNAFTILRAMHGEKVPARSVYVPAEMDNLYSGLNCNQIKVANLTPLPSGKSLYEHFLQFAWERVVVYITVVGLFMTLVNYSSSQNIRDNKNCMFI